MASLIPYFVSGGGFAGIVAFCFAMGWIHPQSAIDERDKRIEKLEHLVDLERARADTGALAVTVMKDVMTALHKEIQ